MNGIKKIKISPCSGYGLGVYAVDNFYAGEKIGYFEGDIINYNTQFSLYLDKNHIEPTGLLKHLNHSCSANAFFSGRWLIASKDIHKNEEITIDYEASESNISHPFRCRCKKTNCRKIIGKLEADNKKINADNFDLRPKKTGHRSKLPVI